MKINGLDDQSLSLIFDRLSVESFLRAGRVCSRWNEIRRKCALSRKSLTLLVGEDAVKGLKKSDIRKIPHYKLLTNKKDNEMQIALPDVCEVMNCPLSNLQINSMFSSFHVNFLSQLFVNVLHFTVSCSDTTSNIQLVNDLLMHWSTKLVTLKLYIHSHQLYDRDNDMTQVAEWAHDRQLLLTINSMASLKVLHLDLYSVDNGYGRASCSQDRNDAEIVFAFVKRLTQFHLNMEYYHVFKYLIDSLNMHGDGLRDIATTVLFDQQQCQRIKPELAQCFSQIYLRIDKAPQLENLCNHFANLTILNCQVTLYSITDPATFHRCLASLKQLIYLHIDSDERSLSNLIIPSRTDRANIRNNTLYADADHRSTSVQVLKLGLGNDEFIQSDYRCHATLEYLCLAHFYPQVRVFIFDRYEALKCDQCEEAGLSYEQYCLKRMLTATGFDPSRVMIKTVEPNRKWSKEDLVIDEDLIWDDEKDKDEDEDSEPEDSETEDSETEDSETEDSEAEDSDDDSDQHCFCKTKRQ